MHNTTPLASEINNDNIMEIYQPHKELTPEATSIDYIHRDQHNLTQHETHINPVNNTGEIGISNCPDPEFIPANITAKTANLSQPVSVEGNILKNKL